MANLDGDGLSMTETLSTVYSPTVDVGRGAGGAFEQPQRGPGGSASDASGATLFEAGSAAWEDIAWEELTVIRAIGFGGFGTVYVSYWGSTVVALKMFDRRRAGEAAGASQTLSHVTATTGCVAPGALEDFARELRHLSTVSHPNCLQLLGCCRDPTHLCLVTEYLKEGDLAGLLFGSKPLGNQTRLDILRKIAAGCEYLHRRKDMVHRDLKPANILLDHDASVVKVADFGLSVAMDKLSAGAGHVAPAGTISYMAPEQLLGEKPTRAGDIFSFGVVMLEVLTRQRAFHGVDRSANVFSAPTAVATGQLAEHVGPLVEACMHPDPAQRPSFTDIGRALADVQQRLVVGPVLPSVPPLPPHFVRREADLAACRAALLASLREASAEAAACDAPQRRCGLCVTARGGTGKSVFASALARDETLLSRFSGGAAWLSVGQKPDVHALLRRLVADLRRAARMAVTAQSAAPPRVGACAGGAHVGVAGDGAGGKEAAGAGAEAVTKVPAAVEHLAPRVRGLWVKAADLMRGLGRLILVLDDVHDAQHVQSLALLVPRDGALLVTTRPGGDVAHSLGLGTHALCGMSERKALSLLARSAQRGREQLPSCASAICAACDRLPLSLAMVGGLLRARRDGAWRRVLHALQQAREMAGDTDERGVAASMEISLQALGPLRHRYVDLAVFPEDTPMTVVMMAALWGELPEPMTLMDVQMVIETFVSHALVHVDMCGDLFLHDLQRAYLCRRAARTLEGIRTRLMRGYARISAPLRLQELQLLEAMFCTPGEFEMPERSRDALIGYENQMEDVCDAAGVEWDAGRAGAGHVQWVGAHADPDNRGTASQTASSSSSSSSCSSSSCSSSSSAGGGRIDMVAVAAATGATLPGLPDLSVRLVLSVVCAVEVPIPEEEWPPLEEGEEREATPTRIEHHPLAVELELDIPQAYPYGIGEPVLPKTAVRSPGFTREAQTRIMADAHAFVRDSMSWGTVRLLNVVEWVRVHTPAYVDRYDWVPGANKEGAAAESSPARHPASAEPASKPGTRGDTLQREWLVFPKDAFPVLSSCVTPVARKHGLTGIVVPSDPGVLVFEGSECDVEAGIDALFRRLRSSNVTPSDFARKARERQAGRHALSGRTWRQFKRFEIRGWKKGTHKHALIRVLRKAGLADTFFEVLGREILTSH